MDSIKFSDLLRVARLVKLAIPNKRVRRMALSAWLHDGIDWRIYA